MVETEVVAHPEVEERDEPTDELISFPELNRKIELWFVSSALNGSTTTKTWTEQMGRAINNALLEYGIDKAPKYGYERCLRQRHLLPRLQVESKGGFQYYQLLGILGWILTIQKYRGMLRTEYEPSELFGERWNTKRWMRMESKLDRETALVPLDISIDGVSAGRVKATKVAFSFSGFPSWVRAQQENWFLLGLSSGHDTSFDTLQEISSALMEEFRSLKKVRLPFQIDGKWYASFQLLNLITDSPVATRIGGSIAPNSKRPCWRCFISKEDCWKGVREETYLNGKSKREMREEVVSKIKGNPKQKQFESEFGIRVDAHEFPVDDIEYAVQPCLLHVEDLNNIKNELIYVTSFLTEKEASVVDSAIRRIIRERRHKIRGCNSGLPLLRHIKGAYRGVDYRLLLQILPVALLSLIPKVSKARLRTL